MNWKNLPYWLKGVMLGVFLGLVSIIILAIFYSNPSASSIRVIEIPGIGLLGFLFIGYLFLILAILGAIVGFIIGKIKSK